MLPYYMVSSILATQYVTHVIHDIRLSLCFFLHSRYFPAATVRGHKGRTRAQFHVRHGFLRCISFLCTDIGFNSFLVVRYTLKFYILPSIDDFFDMLLEKFDSVA